MPITSQMPITQPGSKRRTIKAQAMVFLSVTLAGARVPAADVNRMALERGLTPKALRSAREELGVKIARNGFGPRLKLWRCKGHSCDIGRHAEQEGGGPPNPNGQNSS
jgi:hypothetical protein